MKLVDGMTATVRTGRLGAAGITWSEPHLATLLVQSNARGQAVGLSIKGRNFAEFDPRQHAETPTLFVAEDYALEIISL